VMMYDGEAFKQSLRYGSLLLNYVQDVYVVRLEEGKDPFDYTPQELLSLEKMHVLEALLLSY